MRCTAPALFRYGGVNGSDDDVSFYNSTASTWTLATPRTTWEYGGANGSDADVFCYLNRTRLPIIGTEL